MNEEPKSYMCIWVNGCGLRSRVPTEDEAIIIIYKMVNSGLCEKSSKGDHDVFAFPDYDNAMPRRAKPVALECVW